MAASNELGDIPFGGPATYRIVVQGALDEAWGDRLAGLAVSIQRLERSMPHTTLQGRVLDQAELNGVLHTLYGLHLPILRVERTDGPESDP